MPLSSLQPVYPPPAGRAIEAPWGVAVADAVCQHFASTTERNTRWTSPPLGALASTAADKLFWFYDGTAWQQIGMKSAIDALTASAMPKAGGTFTGQVIFSNTGAGPPSVRRTGDQPYIEVASVAGVRYGYFQGTATGINVIADTGGMLIRSGTLGDITIDSGGAQVRVLDAIYTSRGARFYAPSTDNPLNIAGANTYIGLYRAGTSPDALGTRSGYIGFPNSTTMYMYNEVTNGGILIRANGSGTLTLTTGTSGDISMVCGSGGNILLNASTWGVMYAGGAERGRWGGSFMWGKSTSGSATAGVELFETGVIYSVTPTNTSPNVYLRHNTNADGAAYIQFANASGAILSHIVQDNVAPTGVLIANCTVTAPSDYRLKDDLGPITDAIDRVMRLMPKHLAWKDSGEEFDSFIAHELAEVVPRAVRGEKDAVYEDEDEAALMGVQVGDIKSQQVSELPVIPLLTAALQELVLIVNDLRTRS